MIHIIWFRAEVKNRVAAYLPYEAFGVYDDELYEIDQYTYERDGQKEVTPWPNIIIRKKNGKDIVNVLQGEFVEEHVDVKKSRVRVAHLNQVFEIMES